MILTKRTHLQQASVFIDENGEGPGVSLRKRLTKKPAEGLMVDDTVLLPRLQGSSARSHVPRENSAREAPSLLEPGAVGLSAAARPSFGQGTGLLDLFWENLSLLSVRPLDESYQGLRSRNS
jgi:hypothetical protein